VVRSVRTEALAPGAQSESHVITLADAGDRLEAVVLPVSSPAAANLAQLPGAKVRIRGVYNTSYPERSVGEKGLGDRSHTLLNRLIVSVLRDVQIMTPAPAPEKLPVTPAGDLEPLTESANPHRVKLAGVVTLSIAGKGLFLQDGVAGVWVDMPQLTADLARAGDRAEVLGFPRRSSRSGGNLAEGGGAAAIEDAVLTVTGADKLPDPALVTADEALSGAFHARLVMLEAVVLEVSRLSEGPTLVLQAGERVFLARLPPEGVEARPSPVSENSWVRVAGVCVNNRLASDTGLRPVSFHLMLSGPAAISVVRAPGWWTLEKALIASGIVLAAAVAAFVWVAALRRRVARQTEQLRRHVHQETVHEERMRIARELHDSLEQDLLGITMQLNATEKLLDRPDKARDALTLASAMVRRTQAETHRAVWDLRERKPGQESLVQTLRQALAGLTTGAGGGAPTVTVEVDGTEQELHPQTENHLLRVALEAVTNAFKHAGARSVLVQVRYRDDAVDLSVSDDGKGFDAAHPPDPISGHFGLFGMKERAAKLHGDLRVTSQQGVGTEIRLVAPVGVNGNGQVAGG
jgi:signal transduction histidine kinase